MVREATLSDVCVAVPVPSAAASSAETTTAPANNNVNSNAIDVIILKFNFNCFTPMNVRPFRGSGILPTVPHPLNGTFPTEVCSW